jgi:uncharacterized membrane protein YGL010W
MKHARTLIELVVSVSGTYMTPTLMITLIISVFRIIISVDVSMSMSCPMSLFVFVLHQHARERERYQPQQYIVDD